jgi:hypothetical protein
MKFLKLTNCFFVLVSLVGCRENPQDKKTTPVQPIEKEFPVDQSKEVYEIINCTLKQLIPKSNLAHPTVLVHHQLLVADLDLIKEFVERGGSELLFKLSSDFAQPMPISTRKLKSFGNVQVLETFPLTTAEIDNTIGGAIYSRIMFNKQKTEAAFIFDFSRLHQKKGRVFCAIRMVKSNNKWKLASKVCLENSSKMLIEYIG